MFRIGRTTVGRAKNAIDDVWLKRGKPGEIKTLLGWLHAQHDWKGINEVYRYAEKKLGPEAVQWLRS